MKQKEFWQTEKQSPEQRAELQNERLQEDLLFIARSEQGRRVLKELIFAAGVFSEIPVANANVCAYLEGRRSFGLMLYHRLYALGKEYGTNYLMQIQEQE